MDCHRLLGLKEMHTITSMLYLMPGVGRKEGT